MLSSAKFSEISFTFLQRYSYQRSFNIGRRYSNKSIKNLLSKSEPENYVQTNGWVRRASHQKEVSFVHINDGSCARNLQLVLPSLTEDEKINYGDCISAEGVMKSSTGKQQNLELHVEKWHLHGRNDITINPKLSPKFQDVRNNLEGRVSTPQISAMLRVRNAATHAIHHFFQKEDFIQIHTPIITTNDCEGAGETFQIQLRDDPKVKQAEKKHFFDVPAFLTVSAQLHLEMINNAISKVYTISPTFRGENSRTRQHLSEFYMVEAELAFTKNLEDVMQVIEDLVKTTTEQVYNSAEEDISVCLAKSELKEPKMMIDKLLKNQFVRLSYNDAIDILIEKNHLFKHNVQWGCDLQKEHEFFLVDHCGGVPVFLTDFPASIKPFYMRVNEDDKTVAAVDLLLPEVGELCGGSLREERYDLIKNKVTPDLKWYADMRQFGTFAHGGFGLGFDRYLMLLLGVSNIRDVVVFPRWTHNCQF